ncbi:MAG: DUF5606 domain-containing protein [Bacteroidales bacterium]|jgi:hypothetical protein
MVLKEILSISGEPGLFKFIAQGKNAIIVEHLETKKRSSAFSSAKVSSLDEISVFTEKEDLPLSKVFDVIFEKSNGGQPPDYKSDPEKLKEWFAQILPEYDRNRVYVSDIKKIVHWYNILQRLNMLVKEEPVKEEPTKDDAAAEPQVKEEKEPAKEPAEKKKATAEKKEPEAKKKSSKPKTK